MRSYTSPRLMCCIWGPGWRTGCGPRLQPHPRRPGEPAVAERHVVFKMRPPCPMDRSGGAAALRHPALRRCDAASDGDDRAVLQQDWVGWGPLQAGVQPLHRAEVRPPEPPAAATLPSGRPVQSPRAAAALPRELVQSPHAGCLLTRQLNSPSKGPGGLRSLGAWCTVPGPGGPFQMRSDALLSHPLGRVFAVWRSSACTQASASGSSSGTRSGPRPRPSSGEPSPPPPPAV